MSSQGYISATDMTDEALTEILVPPTLVGAESHNRREALRVLLLRKDRKMWGRGRLFPPAVTHKVHSPHGVLDAYSEEDARAVITYPDSVIIRLSDGAWVDRPLCLDTRRRLAEANPSLDLT